MNHDTTPQATGYGTSKPFKAPFKAKGHDRQLEEAQFGKFLTTVYLLGEDDPIVGKITRRDKFTITVDDGSPEGEALIYKHAIRTLRIDRSTVAN
jgi:sRNA-binding regulator protein Hfq